MDDSRYYIVRMVVSEVVTPREAGVTFANVPLPINIDPHVIFEVAMMKRAAEIN